MTQLQRLLIDDNGKTVEIYIESDPIPDSAYPPIDPIGDDRPGAKGASDEILIKMEDMQEKITTYARFAIGAFQKLGAAQVEEVTLKFSIKLGGKTGIIFTEGKAEGSMEVNVKCTFPRSTNSPASS